MQVSVNITKEDIDRLYHLLRKVSSSGDESIEPVKSIFTHLFYGPAYENLLAFSEFYGREFLLPRVLDFIEYFHWVDELKIRRVVDIGCGRGWLGYGIAHYFNLRPVLVDKRDNIGAHLRVRSIVYTIDLETERGLGYLKTILGPWDLVVACDVLHCIDNPHEFLKVLSPWPMIILEYTSPGNYTWLSSYYHQLKRYGATAFGSEQLTRIVGEATGRMPKATVIDPYLMLVVGGD